MLQLPETGKTAQTISMRYETARAYHARLPAFIKALPNDESILIPLCLSYLQAYDAFSNQATVSWIKRSDAAEDALEKASEAMAEIISYLVSRLAKMPSISPKWEHHYLAVVAQQCINGSLSAEDYIKHLIAASHQIRIGINAAGEVR